MFNVPIKTAVHPTGLLTPSELYTINAILGAWLFRPTDATEESAKLYAAAEVLKILDAVLKTVTRKPGMFRKLQEWRVSAPENLSLQSYGQKLIERLWESGASDDAVIEMIIPSMAALVALQSQAVSNPSAS